MSALSLKCAIRYVELQSNDSKGNERGIDEATTFPLDESMAKGTDFRRVANNCCKCINELYERAMTTHTDYVCVCVLLAGLCRRVQ